MKKFFCIFFLCFLSLLFTGNTLGKYWLEIDCIKETYTKAPLPIESSSLHIHIWCFLYRSSKKREKFMENKIFLTNYGYKAIESDDLETSRKLSIELLDKCIKKNVVYNPKMFEISEDIYNKLLECNIIVKGKTKYSLSDRQQAFDYYFNTVMNLLDTI